MIYYDVKLLTHCEWHVIATSGIKNTSHGMHCGLWRSFHTLWQYCPWESFTYWERTQLKVNVARLNWNFSWNFN